MQYKTAIIKELLIIFKLSHSGYLTQESIFHITQYASQKNGILKCDIFHYYAAQHHPVKLENV